MERTKDQIVQGITKFAEKNGLHIHPGQDPAKWAELVLVKGGCPCVPGRNSCPCANALEDIKAQGRCRCGLFANDGYLENYHSLKNHSNHNHKAPPDGKVLNGIPKLDGYVRESLLKKCAINGFAIEDHGDRITLRPRGAEHQAEITIEAQDGNGYRVVGASGKYTAFGRGLKRKYFEDNVNRWAFEALRGSP